VSNFFDVGHEQGDIVKLRKEARIQRKRQTEARIATAVQNRCACACGCVRARACIARACVHNCTCVRAIVRALFFFCARTCLFSA
jgi:hypothetical protein